MIGFIRENDDLPVGMIGTPGLKGYLTEGGEIVFTGMPVGPDESSGVLKEIERWVWPG